MVVEVGALALAQGAAVLYLAQLDQAASTAERLAVLGFGLAASLAMLGVVFRYQRQVIREERDMRREDRVESDAMESRLRAELIQARADHSAQVSSLTAAVDHLRKEHQTCLESTDQLRSELATVRRQMAEALEMPSYTPADHPGSRSTDLDVDDAGDVDEDGNFSST